MPTCTSSGATAFRRYLNQRLKGEAEPVVVNLASQEYFRAVDRKALKARVVECVFEERRDGGQYKVISFMAKRARGLMARHVIDTRATQVAPARELSTPKVMRWTGEVSTDDRLVFRRSAPTETQWQCRAQRWRRPSTQAHTKARTA